MDEEEKRLDEVIDAIEGISEEDFGELPDDEEIEEQEAAEETEEDSAEEDNLSTDPDEDESRPDNPEEDPDEADDSEADEADEAEEPEGEEEDEPEESPGEEDEDEEGDEADELPGDDLVVGYDDDGEPYTLRDLKNGNLRRADYTQKTMDLSEREKALEQREQERASLTTELLKREETRQFLNENPEALEALLEDPEETRQLISDPDAFSEFWSRWEVVKDDPELQEALTSKRKNEAADEVLDQRRDAKYVRDLGRDLARAVAVVASDYDHGEELADDVSRYVMQLGGLTPEEFVKAAQNDPGSLRDSFETLERLFVQEDDRGEFISVEIIKDRFDHLSQLADREREEEEQEKDEHNKKVEKEIEEEENRPPATPSDASPAGKKPDKRLVDEIKEQGGSLEDFLENSPILS